MRRSDARSAVAGVVLLLCAGSTSACRQVHAAAAAQPLGEPTTLEWSPAAQTASYKADWITDDAVATVWQVRGDVAVVLSNVRAAGRGMVKFPVNGGTEIPFTLTPIEIDKETAKLFKGTAFRGVSVRDPHDVLRMIADPDLGVYISAFIGDQLYFHHVKSLEDKSLFLQYEWRSVRQARAECATLARKSIDRVDTVTLPSGTNDGRLTIPRRKLKIGVLLTPDFVDNASGAPALAASVAFRALQFASQVFEREAAIELVPVIAGSLVNAGKQCQTAVNSGSGNDTGPDPRLICADALITQELGKLDVNVDLGHMMTGADVGIANQAEIGGACGKCKGCGMTAFSGQIFATSVDTLIHEIAHQLGALHSFNADNPAREKTSGYEPGLGSTLMSYAQLGDETSVQSYRDQYFHAGSVNQIVHALPVCTPTSKSCGCDTSLSAVSATTLSGTTTRLVALLRTAFRLKASVSPAGSGSYRARWEEIDTGTAGGSVPPHYRSHPTSTPNTTRPTWDRIWSGEFRPGDEMFGTCSSVAGAPCTLRFQLTARADDRRVLTMHTTTVEISKAGPLTVTATPSNGAVNVSWTLPVPGGALPSGLYTTVKVLIGTGPDDSGWQQAGTANVGVHHFAITHPPFPAGTKVRVLVEAADGSYLALSNQITLE